MHFGMGIARLYNPFFEQIYNRVSSRIIISGISRIGIFSYFFIVSGVSESLFLGRRLPDLVCHKPGRVCYQSDLHVGASSQTPRRTSIAIIELLPDGAVGFFITAQSTPNISLLLRSTWINSVQAK